MLTFTVLNHIDVVTEHKHYENEKQFSAIGGFIGRDESCHWILSDDNRAVSSKHLFVGSNDGQYYAKDIESTNGTRINGVRIPYDKEIKLARGDIIELGLYRILVSSIEDSNANSEVESLLNTNPMHSATSAEGLEFLEEKDLSDKYKQLPFENANESHLYQTRDAFSQINKDVVFDPRDLKLKKDTLAIANESKEDDYQDIVVAEEDDAVLPADLSLLDASVSDRPQKIKPRIELETKIQKKEVLPRKLPEKKMKQPKLQPQIDLKPQSHTEISQKIAEVSENSDFLKILCQRTGLEYRLISQLDHAKIYADIIDVLSYSLDGLIRLTMERNMAKNKLDSDLTMFSSKVKNPIKMSMSAKQALETILFDTNNSVMPARQSVGEAINDVVYHFKALESAMQNVTKDLLKQLMPKEIEKDSPSKKKRVLSAYAKSKYWDEYKAKFTSQLGDSEKKLEKNIKELISEKYNQNCSQ